MFNEEGQPLYTLTMAIGHSAGNKAKTILPSGNILIVQERSLKEMWLWGSKPDGTGSWMTVTQESTDDVLRVYKIEHSAQVWIPI